MAIESGNARYGYILGVALNAVGETGHASMVLERAHERPPGQRDLLTALIAFNRDIGAPARARHFCRNSGRSLPEGSGRTTAARGNRALRFMRWGVRARIRETCSSSVTLRVTGSFGTSRNRDVRSRGAMIPFGIVARSKSPGRLLGRIAKFGAATARFESR